MAKLSSTDVYGTLKVNSNTTVQGFIEVYEDSNMHGRLDIEVDVGATPTYSTGQLELKCQDAGDVSMGFHREGYTACQLRHESNGLILSGTSPTTAANFVALGTISGTNIDSSGNVGGSSTSCTGNAATATWADSVDVNTSTSTSYYNILWHSGDTVYGANGKLTMQPSTGALRSSNNITAYYSDERLKDIQGTIPNALDKVCSLDGFLYKENDLAKSFGYDNDELQVGVSAQKLQEVLPEIVSGAPFDLNENSESISGEDYLTVDYAKITPLLIEAIKELKAEVEELKKPWWKKLFRRK